MKIVKNMRLDPNHRVTILTTIPIYSYLSTARQHSIHRDRLSHNDHKKFPLCLPVNPVYADTEALDTTRVVLLQQNQQPQKAPQLLHSG